MTLPSELLPTFFPELVWLNLDADIISVAKASSQEYSNHAAQHNAYLNHLCRASVLRYLSNLDLIDQPLCSSSDEIWEFVTGSMIMIGKTRLVLLPYEDEQTDDVEIPQEWLDIVGWSADYYVPVQINLQTLSICLLGYISYDGINAKGQFDPIYRTYGVDCSDLTSELDLLWIAQSLGLVEQSNIPTMDVMPVTTELLDRLRQPSLYLPRLSVPMAEWMAVLSDSTVCKQLYQNRVLAGKNRQAVSQPPVAQVVQQKVVNLRQWMTRNLDEAIQQGWETLESLTQSQPLGFVLRNTPSAEVITRAKLINLQAQIGEQSIILLIALTPNIDGTISLQVQLHPDNQEPYLPQDLSLALQDGSTILQSVSSRSQDQMIQLRTFTCTTDTQFSLCLSLGEFRLVEEFSFDASILNT
jgi:Protein of unknown function (DUF1822)